MTQKEKVKELKETIEYLYCKEGRSKSYISRLLVVDRKTLSIQIDDWGLIKANAHYLTPSNQKFANKNKQLIKSRLDNDISIVKIANELGVSYDYLQNIINRVDILRKAKHDYKKRLDERARVRKEQSINKSSRMYNFDKIDGEIWKEILGYDGYYVSNMGRIKRYSKHYNKCYLLVQQKNSYSGRMYVKIENKGLQVARLVGFAFVDGYSKQCNTIEHKDNNITNNKWDNLMWVSQSTNNKLAYKKGRPINIAYQKHGKFKKILLDDKYEFKTITALANFLEKSISQVYRYIDGECKFDRKIEIIY